MTRDESSQREGECKGSCRNEEYLKHLLVVSSMGCVTDTDRLISRNHSDSCSRKETGFVIIKGNIQDFLLIQGLVVS